MMDTIAVHGLPWLAALAGALVATGLVAGLMAGLIGIGGGIVIVPVLYNLFTWLGIDPSVRMHVAVATSLATIVPTSIVSAHSHYQRGSLDTDLLRSLAPAILAGVVAGTVLAGWLSGAALTAVFAMVALIVALNMALRSSSAALARGLPDPPARLALGAVIGGFSSLMGIGGGSLAVPLLRMFNVPMRRAVGTGAAISLIISVPGALGMLISGLGAAHRPPGSLGYVNFIGFALIVPATVLMAPIGARMAHRVNPVRLCQVFALFLLLTSLHMFIDLFGA